LYGNAIEQLTRHSVSGYPTAGAVLLLLLLLLLFLVAAPIRPL
jgi:hypothetical protein